MNRRSFFSLLALASLAWTAPHAVADASKNDGIAKYLRAGQTWRIDQGLKVTFVSVRNDSRCPINARCIWEGDAEVVLRVTVGNRKPQEVILHTTLDPRLVTIPAQSLPDGMIGIPKSYVISLRQLTPQPVAGKTIPQTAYRAKLRVLVAQ
jgi:hypothetical protein